MYPTLDEDVFSKMQEVIESARLQQDSVGGIVECAIINVPAGIGNPFFDSIESHLSPLLFSIPAVKSVKEISLKCMVMKRMMLTIIKKDK